MISGLQYRKKPGIVTTKYVKSGVPFTASRTAFWIFEPHGEQYQRPNGSRRRRPDGASDAQAPHRWMMEAGGHCSMQNNMNLKHTFFVQSLFLYCCGCILLTQGSSHRLSAADSQTVFSRQRGLRKK